MKSTVAPSESFPPRHSKRNRRRRWLGILPLVAGVTSMFSAMAQGQGAFVPFSVPLPTGDVLFEVPGEYTVRNGGFGSGMAKHPTRADAYYLMTDRGPNVDGIPTTIKLFPNPGFAPQIGLFRLENGEFIKEQVIELKDQVRFPLTGLPNPVGFGGTGETPQDIGGNPLALDPTGVDPEGLVAMPDGTFWVSDEYGPHLIHFAADGRTIERINPFGLGLGGRRLPAVYANRRANRGMEGLTVTPDGQWLVGMMQSQLDNPVAERTAIRANSRVTRILFFNVATAETKEYVYLLDTPTLTNSEIRALSDTEFVVLERNAIFPGAATGTPVKKLYKINITGATDVSDPLNSARGKSYLVEGVSKTLEQLSLEEIEAEGIVPVSKNLMLDIIASIPDYPHDKPEGFEVLADNVIAIINDDDFGILSDGIGGIMTKTLPLTGQVDTNVMHFVRVPELVASFAASATNVLSADTVAFTAAASGGIGGLSYFWDFGDGTTSTEENPEKQFEDTGVYTVTLTVTDSDGTEVVVSQVDYIVATEATEEEVPENLSDLRIATYNVSLNRSMEGQLITDLSSPDNVQAQQIAEILQQVRPEIVLLNEFDYDAGGVAAQSFRENYLGVSQGGLDPLDYPYVYVAPSNTGIDSGFDLDNDGTASGTGNDAFGFGFFPGQFAFVLYSMHPIDDANVRTFQNFLWKDMPGALLPDDPATPAPADFYSAAELDVFRLSSKNHVDVPVTIAGRTVHLLLSHPTPPVFDGAEDRNGTRNHDEIRFWADYIDPAKSGYIVDDLGGQRGLPAGASFVIMGDQNADPTDGDGVAGAIDQLLLSDLVDARFTPRSDGGVENNDGGVAQSGDPGEDTAAFNLRADYVLPSKAGFGVQGGGVFWPISSDVRYRKVTEATDHRLVYLDLDFRLTSDFVLQVLHASDNESSFQDPNTLEEKILGYAQVIDGLGQLAAGDSLPSIYVTAGDHSLPGPFYQAAVEAASLGARGLGDIEFYNAMGLVANGMGNHEFDGGINDFAAMLASANYPFLAVNLDFSNVVVSGGAPSIEIGVDASSVVDLRGKVARSAWVEVAGEKIGLIGRAPADFFNVVSNPTVTLPGLDFVGGRDAATNQPLVSALQLVLEQVDLLSAQGIDKIILLDHAQDFTGDPLASEALRGIDIIVSAGSTGFLASDFQVGPYNNLRPGDRGSAAYPVMSQDSEGHPVLVVNSEQLYRYVGNLIVGFDADGHIDAVDKRSGPIATTEQSVEALGELLGTELEPTPAVQAIWDSLRQTTLIQNLFEVVGTTEEPLNGLRADVRFRETNLGRVAADSTLWYAQQYLDDNNVSLEVDIALKNGGGIRDTIAGPNVTRLTIATALAFDNQLAIIRIKASELLAAMENSVSRYPARDGRFPQVAGMNLQFDPSRPAIEARSSLLDPSRVGRLVVTRANGSVDVVVENFRLVGDPSRTFVLATNNFLLTGGDGYAAFASAATNPSLAPITTTEGEQAILANYVINELSGEIAVSDRITDPRVTRFSSGIALSSFETGVFDGGRAEIVDFDPVTRRIFVSNATGTIDFIGANSVSSVASQFEIATAGGEPNSLVVMNGVLAVAVQNDPKTDPGWVVFYDTATGTELNRLTVGALPDMITITPDGSRLVVANEGEPSDDYDIDPEGSISIIDVGVMNPLRATQLTSSDVRTGGFGPLSSLPFLKGVLRAAGVRLFGNIMDPETGEPVRESTIAEDLEPEYIAISPDSTKAYVACQEGNVLAVFDLASGGLIDLVPFGFKDHSLPGNGFDASDRDGGINILSHPTWGMYQPDGMAAFEAVGETFLITANEGDSRDYDGYSEEERVRGVVLDPTAFPDRDTLRDNANLGRLKLTTANGDSDGDGDFDQIFSFGARSFSIWDERGRLVYDSGDMLERIVAEFFPENFNASNDSNSFDGRSDDKGPEPEGVTVGEIDGRLYAFLGIERMSGFMIFDITYPYNPTFVDYVNNRNFDFDPEDELALAGDLGPEGLKFVSASDSPTGVPLLIVANEISGSTSVFELTIAPTPGYVLQLLHSSDNESSFQDPNTGEEKILGYSAVVEGLKTVGLRDRMNTLHLTAGDHTLPGPFYQAAAEVSELGARGLADIAFYNAMGLTANGMGNHEFDGGIDDFATMLASANYPFIAANLDFSNVMLDAETPAIEIGVDGGSVVENAGKVCRSAWVEIGGEKIGLVGRAPADFFNVIANPSVTIPGLDFVGGRDAMSNQPLESAIPQVLAQVALLEAQGINKIILLDHAQDFTGDPLSATSLRGIDIVVAAGSTGFMAGSEVNGAYNLLRPGDSGSAAYPTVRTDSEDNTVLVVNSEQLFRYVGQLIVVFDSQGHIRSIDPRSGPIATTSEAAVALESETLRPVLPSAEVSRIWGLLQDSELITDLFTVVGTTTTELDGLRANVRTRETNLGRLAADSTLWFAGEFGDENSIGFEVDIALKNGGGIRDTIVGPNVTRLAIGAALAFDNRLAIVQIDAAELLATMENAVSRYPAADGRFPQIAGMSIEFDPMRPGLQGLATTTSASRIFNLSVTRASGAVDRVVIDGEFAGDPSRLFGLATNNFLLTGGDGYASLAAAAANVTRTVFETEDGEQSILAQYIIDELGGEVDLPEPFSDSRVILVTPMEGLAYAQWVQSYGTPGAAGLGESDDLNGDGFTNYLSFLFNVDPGVSLADSGKLPQVSVGASGVVVSFETFPIAAARWEVSSDLSAWDPALEGTHYQLISASPQSSGTVVYTIRMLGSDSRVFFRVGAEVPSGM